MISSTFKAAGCLLFIFCICVYAQNPAKKPATSTISGKITLKGTGVAGISVGARQKESNRQGNAALTTTTDSQGNYRISNVPPGTYEIGVGAPQFVLISSEPLKTLIVGEGETFDGIDFALVRGGVITGRVTDSEGRPLIEENVEVSGPEGSSSLHVRMNLVFIRTDDRGVYRAFRLPPGKYRVSAGMHEEELYYGRSARNSYVHTFHPSTTEQAKATLVEVTEGGEAANVDIMLRRTQTAFVVSGKIVDAETGKPMPNIIYGLEKYREDGSSASSGMATNKHGEFRFDQVTPGKYSVFAERSGDAEVYAEPLRFEVTDEDVSGLVLKVSGGTTLSGVIIVDGVDEKTGRALVNGMTIVAWNEDAPERFSNYRPSHAMVDAGGSFRLGGVPPGVVKFMVYGGQNGERSECEITRIERNGVLENRKLELKEREQLTGLRLFVKYHRGSIRGVIKIENGALSSTERVHLIVVRVGDREFQTSAQLDARGRFTIAGLKSGVYEVSAIVFLQDAVSKTPKVKQQVVVADNQASEVTLTLDLGRKQ